MTSERLAWHVESSGDVVLVELQIENPTAVDRRVRIADRTGGPLWPPRRSGVPEAGWDDGGFEGVLRPGESRALGYATSGQAVEPPAEIAWSERAAKRTSGPSSFQVDEIGGPGRTEIEDRSTAAVCRALADPRPPRDAVALPDVATPEESVESGANVDPPVPPELDAWFDSVEDRIGRAESLSAESSLLEVAREIEGLGELEAVETLARRVRGDAQRLRIAERRAGALADRADGVEVPVDAFRRLR